MGLKQNPFSLPSLVRTVSVCFGSGNLMSAFNVMFTYLDRTTYAEDSVCVSVFSIILDVL